jgi:hypothetical protein
MGMEGNFGTQDMMLYFYHGKLSMIGGLQARFVETTDIVERRVVFGERDGNTCDMQALCSLLLCSWFFGEGLEQF